jgi:hypothetical protein
MIAMIVFLVVLVGGVSVLGTMAVLVEEEALPATEPGPVEQPQGIDQGDIKSDAAESEQVPTPAGDPALPVEAAKGPITPPTPVVDVTPLDAARDEKVEEAAAIVGNEPQLEDGSASRSPGTQNEVEIDDTNDVEGSKTAATKKRPMHETAECAKTRDDAGTAYKARQWGKLLDLTRNKAWCWSSAQKLQRVRLHVRALAELERYAECVKAGGSSKDPEIKGMVDACRKNAK